MIEFALGVGRFVVFTFGVVPLAIVGVVVVWAAGSEVRRRRGRRVQGEIQPPRPWPKTDPACQRFDHAWVTPTAGPRHCGRCGHVPSPRRSPDA